MSNLPFGYGDSDGQGSGGYGDHQFGYGHPLSIIALTVEGGPDREDLGGDTLNFDTGANGALPAGPFQVTIGGVGCYSGVMGQGTDVYPDAARRKFSCALPHLFGQLGAVDLVILHLAGPDTYVGVINVRKHVGRTMGTLLALQYPREVYSMPIPVARP